MLRDVFGGHPLAGVRDGYSDAVIRAVHDNSHGAASRRMTQ
jgi:hypothetical protein